jgi:D-amino peptidase
MRVYISVDMEGVAGVVHEDQTNPADPRCAAEYARFRRLMTLEANAAVEGALAGGATQVVVNDAHWFMRNLLAEELHEAAELVSGDPKPLTMMQGIGDGFDTAFFVGYHAMAGTSGAVLDHTYTDRVAHARLNGTPIGELGLNAALAGAHAVPVTLVTGDQAVAAEARAFLGDGVVTAVVKDAIGRQAARCLSPATARTRIREAAEAAVRRRPAPYRTPSPSTIEVEFRFTTQAEMAELLPGSERRGPRTVAYTHDDYVALFRAWRALYNLAGCAG